ncbi:winged helix-turn-helix domain-containing protein [Natronosporangium hydrolyticum]|uniref:Winged helix-turn-helix domain-containing protein n=1 Tax=Natronosporangium hydrolyticum TaxID=2811111 RepID=A0A895YC46_9ACTN|nr:BTAD domain-containing putative transcriptional regulator [Natronosporangium hydrolyticum]QSB15031.1 winged helix-turn-helix domain-containing protein [Natronosporangium hydrolyticum]
MRFGILGPTQVWLDRGEVPALGGRRLRALLVRLLLDAGRLVTTERLIDDLYGAEPPAGAANALQSQVSRLRRVLGDDPPVESPPAGYRLAVASELVDAHQFQRLTDAGRRAVAAGEYAAAAAGLAEALALWRGPALADVADAPFAPAWVAHLDEQRHTAVEQRIEARLQLGEAEEVLPELRRLLADEPARERLWAQLLRALAATGQPAEALATFEAARRTLADQYGVDPSPQLREVHRAILRGDAEVLGPAAPSETPPAGLPKRSEPPLPAPLTSFVGRDAELAQLATLLATSRLVTVTGPGGVGKTRLALSAAGAALADGPTRLVELAPVSGGGEVAGAVLAALGLRESGLRGLAGSSASSVAPEDPVARLITALQEQPMLLVLDNCEQVIEAVAALSARLLSACGQLRILATSREPLGITGEALLPLGGLALPPADAATAADSPAVRLLLDRAADVAPGSAIPPAVAATICRTLDGLPLAIELAAARLRSLTYTEVAERLDDRFRLLSRGDRTVEPRHQTLRGVVEWSWDLLREPEQVLARRLAVFAGGATIDAVERVAAGSGEDSLELLTSLVDKSIVERFGDRYRMLETIRAYGAERLLAAGEQEQLRRAHAGYYLELARTADPYLRTADQLEWLARLDAERDNLHTALRNATGAGDLATALGLCSALAMYWWLRGLLGEAARLAQELSAAIGPAPAEPPSDGHPAADLPEEYAVCVLIAAAGSRQRPTVSAAYWSAEALAVRTRRPFRQPFLYYLSAMAAGPPRGEPAELVELITAHFELASEPWIRGLSPLGIAIVQAWRREWAQAAKLLAEAGAIFSELGERWGMLVTLANQAELARYRGEPAAGIADLDEALRLAGELDSIVDMADVLRVRGENRRAAGDLTGAAADLRRAAELAARAGAPELVASARVGEAVVALDRGDVALGRELAEQALAACPTGGFAGEATRSGILVVLGAIAARQQRPAQAREYWAAALRSPVPALGELASAALDQALADGDPARAARVLGAASVLARDGFTQGWPGPGRTAVVVERLGRERFAELYEAVAALPPEAARRVLLGE